MSLLTVGVLKSPDDEADKRLPIHPDHFAGLEPDLAKHLLLESGYAHNFGVTDRELDPLVGGFMTREQLIDQADVLLVVDPSVAGSQPHATPVKLPWGWLTAARLLQRAPRERGLDSSSTATR